MDRLQRGYEDPEARCHLPGVPRALDQPGGLYPVQIIQDEKYVALLHEAMHDVRIIPTDNSPHPRNYWAWDGDSRGRWEGDTFVVDVSNFNGRTWLDMAGELRRRERTRPRAIHADRSRHDSLRSHDHRPNRLRQTGRDAFHAETCARGAADSRIQLPRRRAKPAALHRRRRRQEAEGAMSMLATWPSLRLRCRWLCSAGSAGARARRRRDVVCRQPACGTARRRTFAASGRCATRPTSTSKAIPRKRASPPQEHHRRSARREDSVQTGGARAAARELQNAGDRRSVDQVLSGRRSPRDVSSDSTADSSEPGQLCDRLPGESRVSRFPSGHAAALRQHRLVDGRYALSVGGRHAGCRRRRADRSGVAGPGRKLPQHRDPHRRTLPHDRRRYDRVRSTDRRSGRLLEAVDAADRSLSRQATGSADHRGRVPRGRERRSASYFPVRSEEPAEIRLLALEESCATGLRLSTG